MPEHHVFISYSRKQFNFTVSLAVALRRLNVPVWLDLEQLQPGADWTQSIQADALEQLDRHDAEIKSSEAWRFWHAEARSGNQDADDRVVDLGSR